MIDKGKKGVCPPLRGNSMTSLHIMFVLMLIIMVVLLATGCVGQGGEGKSAENGISSVPIPSSIPTPTQIEPPQITQDGYWIKIDPISDKQAGDIFIVTSTTNVSVGEEILVQVYSPKFFPGGQQEFSGTTGNVEVIPGSNGINTISFVVNTSAFRPNEYVVTEDAIGQDATGFTQFNILPAPISSGNTTLKPKNFIDWEKLDLPTLKVNNSMEPENPSFAISDSDPCQTTNGSIILFSTDGIVRIFDKNGAQTGACYDSRDFHSHGVPSGTMIDIRGNVTTVFYGGERILTEIHEAGD
jgi:hypothetical protein